MTRGEYENSAPSEPTLERSLDDALGQPDFRPDSDGTKTARAPTAHLLVVQGPETGRMIRLTSAEAVLGRGEDVAGKLHDPSASQRHAKVLRHGGGFVLVDLGSTNGTYLNEEHLEGPVLLAHGDSIRIGTTVLRFLFKEGTESPGKTVPLEKIPPAQAAKATRDLVRFRDARLTPWGPRRAGPEDHGTGSDADWVHYLRAGVEQAKRYGAFVCIMAAVGLAAGGLHAALHPPLGSAYFEITLSRDAKANPVEEERADPFFVAAERNFTSTTLIKQTLKNLDLPATETNALAVQRRVNFSPLDKHERVWRGEYESADADDARAFLTRHLQVYLEHELDRTLHVLKAQIQLLEEQVEKSGEELRKTEEELAAFKKAHPGVVGAENSEQYASLSPLQSRRDDLSAQVKRLKLELNLNRQRLQSGDAIVQGRVSSTGSYLSALQDIEKQISEAQAEGLGEAHPKLKRLRGQARELQKLREAAINQEATDLERRSNEGYVAIRERVRDLEVALRVAETELGQVTERLREMEGRVGNLPEAEAQLAKLTRNYASTKTLHDKLYQKLRASRIQFEIERESARARYDLLTPPTPEHPDLTASIAQRSGIGAFGMFFLATVWAAVRETFRYLKSIL